MNRVPESTFPDRSPRPRRAALWKRAAAVLLVATTATVGVTIAALGHLEHPWVKPLIVRTVRSKLGLDVDYRTLAIDPLHGRLWVRGLTLAQPARFRGTEPTFVTLDSLTAGVGVRALLAGELRASDVVLRGLVVTYVTDERTDTFSLAFPSDPNTPPTPLSRSFDALHDLGVDVVAMRVDGARLRYVELANRAVVLRADVDALGLTGHLHALRHIPDLRVHLAPARSTGTVVTLDRAESSASGDARAPAHEVTHVRARIAIDATLAVKDSASLRVASHVLEQTGLNVAAGALVATSADVAVAFDPRAGRTHLDVRRVSVADERLVASLSATVDDRSTDTLRDATGEGRVAFDELPFPIEGLDARRVRARVSLEDALLSPVRIEGRVDGAASAERLVLERGAERAGGDDLALTLSTRADIALDPDAPRAPNELPFRSLHAELRGRTFFVEDASEGEEARVSVHGEALEATVNAADTDDASGTVARLDLALGRTMSARATTLALRVGGAGLAAAIVSGAPITGTATVSAAHLSARDGGDAIDVAPVVVACDLHELASGNGLFGLGGSADVRVRAEGSARSGTHEARFGGFAPSARVSFDRGTIEGTVPVATLAVREGASTTLALRGAEVRIASENATTLTRPDANGRVRVEGRIGHLAWHASALSLPDFAIEVKGQRGTYAVDGMATIAELETAGIPIPGTHPFALDARLDSRTQIADLRVSLGASGASEASPRADTTLHVEIDPRSGAVTSRLSSDATHVAPVVALFLPNDARAEFGHLHVEGDGRLVGIFGPRAREDAFPALVDDVPFAVRGEQRLSVLLEDVDVRSGESRVESPRVELGAEFLGKGGPDNVVGVHADAERVIVSQGANRLGLNELHPVATITIPSLAHPTRATMSADTRIGRVDQRVVSEYPVSDVRVSAVVDSTETGAVLREFRLVDGGSRASLRATGAYEREPAERVIVAGEEVAIRGRGELSLEGAFEHDLAPLSGTTFARSASGRLEVPFTIESDDLASFHCMARILASRVDFETADGGFRVTKLDGEIPIDEVVVLLESGVFLDTTRGTDPVTRAPDAEPVPERESSVTVESVAFGDEALAQLAGNVRVSGTAISVDRLEVGARGGRVVGQLVADLRPGAASISFRGDATGIHTSRSGVDTLDAILALRFEPETLAIDGTVQLVRLGRGHLSDVLDTFDAFHLDAAINRIRSLLRLSHPASARIRVADGLIELSVKLSGLARAMRVETVRAIPIGPLLEDRIAPYTDPIFRPAQREVHVSGPDDSGVSP